MSSDVALTREQAVARRLSDLPANLSKFLV
jgi:hypothetical protein